MSSVTEADTDSVSAHQETCPWCHRSVEMLVVNGLGRVCPQCLLVFPGPDGSAGGVMPDE